MTYSTDDSKDYRLIYGDLEYDEYVEGVFPLG